VRALNPTGYPRALEKLPKKLLERGPGGPRVETGPIPPRGSAIDLENNALERVLQLGYNFVKN